MASRHGRRTAWVLSAALVAAGAWALAWAQDDGPPEPPSSKVGETPAVDEVAKEATAEEEAEPEVFFIENADNVRWERDPKDPDNQDAGFYYLTGNVHGRHKDAHLYADEITYNMAEDSARAVGNLRLVQPDSVVTSDLMTANFTDEVAVAEGNVRIVYQKVEDTKAEGEDGEAKPAENDEAATEDEEDDKWAEYKAKQTVVTCEKATVWYEEDRALAEGNVVAVQEDKTVWADTAVYVEAEDTLTLEGDPVKFKRENGDRGQTPKAVIHIEEERFETGTFRGVFRQRDKKDEEKPDDTPEPKPEPEPTPEPPDEPPTE